MVNFNYLLNGFMVQDIKIFNILFVLILIACSNTVESKQQQLDEKSIYTNSDVNLNNIYSDVKNNIRNNKNELNKLIQTQREWLKSRNSQCNFDGKNLSIKNYKCLSTINHAKVDVLKTDYLNFESLENSLIKPFKYTTGTQKKLEVGGCWCNESVIKITKDKIYIYQACDVKLKQPRIYRVLSKKIEDSSVEYSIDTNNNGVPEFNLSFITNGKNVWTIIPKAFRKDDLINLNFSINYTTDIRVGVDNNDCANQDE